MVIPGYNSGPLLVRTVLEVLAVWRPVIVVDDGSTDGNADAVRQLATREPGLHVLTHPRNRGKGAAVLTALLHAAGGGLTHAAVFDSDGQHDAADLPALMQASSAHPGALVMGIPQFGADAPAAHIAGHRIADFLAKIETRRPDLGDSLFGLRVYPIAPTLATLQAIRGGRRFDFDTQMAVRLPWLGLPHVNMPARVRYPRQDRIRHFRYLRDNALLVRVHAGLLLRAVTGRTRTI